MDLIVETPRSNAPEREYILGVILGEFLGLTWLWVPAERTNVCIKQNGVAGEIHLPDIFFAQPPSEWLTAASLPSVPLVAWDTADLSEDITLTHPVVPVLYGATDPVLSRSGTALGLPIDLFGSAFFMLSRYEEAILADRDNHDRFPAMASLAYQAGFLDRPIVDEYVEILWTALQSLWPGLQRQPRQARTIVSCDVDSPFATNGALKGMGRRLAGDLLKRRSTVLACNNFKAGWRAWRGDYSADPNRSAIDWIMEVNERAGRTVAFYFIPENTEPVVDNRVSLDEPRMRGLLRTIHERGHEIGLHPGYHTYKHPEAMAQSVATLRRVLAEERIEQMQLGGRQHFLRWETPITARLWDENGLDYDSTLAFADRLGFRCGTCHEYPLYDLQMRRPLRLREQPLILMECTVIWERYMGLGYSEAAINVMLWYRDICRKFDGMFTLLWHNSHMTQDKDKLIYLELIQ